MTMENENQEQLDNVLELSPKPSRRSRRSEQSERVEEKVLSVTVDESVEMEPIKEMETIVVEAPAPAAPTPPAPAAAPNPEPSVAIQPKKSDWKPLVRPRRQAPPSSGPGRHQRKAL